MNKLKTDDNTMSSSRNKKGAEKMKDAREITTHF